MGYWLGFRPTHRFKSIVQQHEPWIFPILYLGWALLFWIPLIFSDAPVWSIPNVFLLLLGGMSPVVAGVVLLWVTAGWNGYTDLVQRLTEINRIPRQWWLIITLYYPGFTWGVAAIVLVLGITDTPITLISIDRLSDPTAVVLLIAVAFVFPTVEEIGLRGYWFDQLQARWSALTASLILGTVWALWHLPLFYMTGYYSTTTFDPQLWWFLPSLVFTAIIGTWVYNNTQRSVLAVISLHFFGNLTGEVVGLTSGISPLAAAVTIAIATLLVAVYGPESLRGWNTKRPIAPRYGN